MCGNEKINKINAKRNFRVEKRENLVGGWEGSKKKREGKKKKRKKKNHYSSFLSPGNYYLLIIIIIVTSLIIMIMIFCGGITGERGEGIDEKRHW